MGARGRRPHRLPVRRRAAPDRGGAQRRRRARRRVRRRWRRSRRPRASWSRRCRGRRRRRGAQRRRPAGRARWPRAPPARVVTFGASAGRRRAGRGRAARRRAAAPSFTAATPEGSTPSGHPAAARRAPGLQRAGRRRRGARAGGDAGRRRRGAGDRRPAQPVADGGRPTGPDGVTVVNDAYNANPDSVRAALDALVAMARRRGRTWAVLGEMRRARRGVRRRARARSADWPRRLGRRPARRRRATGRARMHDGAVAEGARRRRGRVVVADVDGRARRCCAPSCGPGDVVLVKASRAAGLERSPTRCSTGRGRAGSEAESCSSPSLSACHRAVRHAAGDPVAGPARLRPADPRRRPDLAPHQARHADHGRRRHHRRHRCSATSAPTSSPGGTRPSSGLLVLFLMTGLGLVGLPRRLHQGRQAAQPRAAGRRQAGRPDWWSPSRSRSSRCSSRTATGYTPASTDVSFIRDTGARARRGAVRRLGLRHDRRHVQRREPHRRPRRAGHRRLGDGVRRLRAHRHLAVRQRLRPRRRAAKLLRGARPARPRGGRRGGDGRLLRLPVVERVARPRSSWATPARWPSAARSPGSRSSAAPSCCWCCSAACSCSSRCR